MTTSREKVQTIFNLKNSNEGAFWTGNPSDEIIPKIAAEWEIEPSKEAIYRFLNDDCRWVNANLGYKHPDGLLAFDPSYGMVRDSLSAEGCLAHVETIAEIDAYPWPDVEYCDFTEIYEQIDQFSDKMVFTGLWSGFFYITSTFFGMENYFIKMYEAPELVEAVSERIVDFYVSANDMFFRGLDNRADVMFIGNDFGTQLDLFVSPELFRKFVLPYLKRLINVGKKHGKKIMLHSCGSIARIIPDLIDAGIDALHPIQAQAFGMSAVDLAQYKNHIAFVGGIDAQSFIVNAAPMEIEAEVQRVRDILGPNLVISPSHEQVLPNVPPANILAMSKAALRQK